MPAPQPTRPLPPPYPHHDLPLIGAGPTPAAGGRLKPTAPPAPTRGQALKPATPPRDVPPADDGHHPAPPAETSRGSNALVIAVAMALMAGSGVLFMSMFNGRPSRTAALPTTETTSSGIQGEPVGSAVTTLAQAPDSATPSGNPSSTPGRRASSTRPTTSNAPTRAPEPGAQTPSSRAITGESMRVGSYGSLRVKITLDGSRISGITVPTYPVGTVSGDLNARAVPQLVRQAMAAQSAAVDGVSGATLTSIAFRQSLQHAINRARA